MINLKNINRSDIVIFAMLIAATIILFRCINLQYKDTKKYSNLIEDREIKSHIIKTSRGTIVDRNNNILAESIPMNSLIVTDTTEFFQDKVAIEKLATILNVKTESIYKELKNKENKKFSYIRSARHIPIKKVKKIRNLNLSGITFIKEYKRYYPEGEVLASLIGMTDFDHNGQMCIELSFDEILKGRDGKKIVVKDKNGKIVDEIEQVITPQEGKELKLTIDTRLQYVAYRELKKQIISSKAASGSVVILDTTNGEILASASYPSFDPNNRSTYTHEGARNRVIIDALEPASTIKPFLLAAALHSKKVNLNDIYDTTPGYKRIGNKIYRDYKNYGRLTTEEVIINSSNLGSIMISEKFNKKIFYELLEHIGVGEKVNLNFPSEVEGALKHYSEWKNSDVRSLAMGYAFKVTPLQLAKAYSVIANDGLVINPKFVKSEKTQIHEEKKYENEFKQVKKVIKKVIEDGTAKRAAIEGYTVGGKTGTARLYTGNQKKDKYSNKEHISLFAGITPLDKPKLAIVVIVNQPKTKVHFGGYVAAPVFKKIATDSLRILNISPDNISDNKKQVSNKIEKISNYSLKTPEVANVF